MSIWDRPHPEWTNDDVRPFRTGAEYCLDYFEAYDPHRPRVDIARAKMSYGEGNVAGYQQRSFLMWLCFRFLLVQGEAGIEFGSAGVKAPWCLDTDGLMGEISPYNSSARVPGKMKIDASQPLPFGDGTFNLAISSHVFEHLHGDPVGILREWLRVVKPGGAVGMIIPDNDYFDVMASDPTHVRAWGATGRVRNWGAQEGHFRDQVLSGVADMAVVEAYNTLDNDFSFDVVLVRR